MVRAEFPKTKLIYVSLKPSPSRWKLAENFRRSNDLIKAEGEPMPRLFGEDKLNLNEKGYAIWRDTLVKNLK